MWRSTWLLLRQTFQEWTADKVPQLGAALAFYAALSIAPLIVLSVRLVAILLGEQAAQEEVRRRLPTYFGDEGAQAIFQMLAPNNAPSSPGLTAVVSLLALAFAGSGVFSQLQDSLNSIWGVRIKPHLSWFATLRERAMPFVMVLLVSLVLLTSMLLSSLLVAVERTIQPWSRGWPWIMQGIDLAVSISIVAALFAVVYKVLPDIHLRWKDVAVGALVAAVLFGLGKSAIGYYLGHSNLASTYGVAGSFMALLLWIYYSSQIFYFGAELTQVYAQRTHAPLHPTKNAEFLPCKEE